MLKQMLGQLPMFAAMLAFMAMMEMFGLLLKVSNSQTITLICHKKMDQLSQNHAMSIAPV